MNLSMSVLGSCGGESAGIGNVKNRREAHQRECNPLDL